jgi:hypothetical protein
MQPIEPTPEQLARLPEFLRKWTGIALSTAPIDRARAEWDLARFYATAGLAEPRVIWLPCPMSAALSAIAYARVTARGRQREMQGRGARTAFIEAIADELLFANYDARRPIQSAIERALGSALRRARGEGGFPLPSDIGKAAGAARHTAFGFALPAGLQTLLHNEIIVPLWRAVDGILLFTRKSLELVEHRVRGPESRIAAAAWLSRTLCIAHAAQMDYADRVLKVPMDRSYVDTMESCGAYWSLDGICFAAERPRYINRDEAGRLHCEVGPSMAYRSGWSWWHWHGLEVAQYVVEEPQRISVRTIEGVHSPELRRILVDRYRHGEEMHGAAAFLRDAGAKRLDHDPAFGTLWYRDLSRDEPIVMVEVVNHSAEPDGSFKRYLLRVDPRLRPIRADGSFGEPQPPTARNAVASTFGLSGAEYAPGVET